MSAALFLALCALCALVSPASGSSLRGKIHDTLTQREAPTSVELVNNCLYDDGEKPVVVLSVTPTGGAVSNYLCGGTTNPDGLDNDGDDCAKFVTTTGSSVFWLAPQGIQHFTSTDDGLWLSNYGAATLAELELDATSIWYDISRVKGYNFPVSIEPFEGMVGSSGESVHSVACGGVNCADAYWMGDTNNPNLFNPNYVAVSNGAPTPGVRVTFCPEGTPDSVPLASAYPNDDSAGCMGKNPREYEENEKAGWPYATPLCSGDACDAPYSGNTEVESSPVTRCN